MAYNLKRMAAIVLSLKKRGLWREIFGGAAKALSSIGQLSRVKINLAGKQIPLNISKVAASRVITKTYLSPKGIEKYLKAIPAKHLKEMNVKGLYVVSGHEFNRMMGGIIIRTAPPESVAAIGPTMKARHAAAKIQGMKARQIGLHQNGRVVLNADGLSTVIDDQARILGIPLEKKTLFGTRLTKGFLFHELGHNFDSSASRYMMGAAHLKITKETYKSLSPEFMRAIGAKPSDYASPLEEIVEKNKAVEGFADLYGSYLMDAKNMKLTMPDGYKAIKPFFEGK